MIRHVERFEDEPWAPKHKIDKEVRGPSNDPATYRPTDDDLIPAAHIGRQPSGQGPNFLWRTLFIPRINVHTDQYATTASIIDTQKPKRSIVSIIRANQSLSFSAFFANQIEQNEPTYVDFITKEYTKTKRVALGHIEPMGRDHRTHHHGTLFSKVVDCARGSTRL
jgi:hypothetical protein